MQTELFPFPRRLSDAEVRQGFDETLAKVETMDFETDIARGLCWRSNMTWLRHKDRINGQCERCGTVCPPFLDRPAKAPECRSRFSAADGA